MKYVWKMVEWLFNPYIAEGIFVHSRFFFVKNRHTKVFVALVVKETKKLKILVMET